MSDDVIRRSDVIKAIFSKPACHGSDGSWYHSDDIRDAVDSTPSADRPQGEWILECDAKGEDDNLYRCSECGCNYGCQEYDIPNFCPNCGMRMKGKE